MGVFVLMLKVHIRPYALLVCEDVVSVLVEPHLQPAYTVGKTAGLGSIGRL